MQTKIAKIVKSNSHVDYIARVIDALDAENPPPADSYGFAQFVSIPLGDADIIGVIYNSALVNPEYGSFGPRLSPASELAVLSPDYLNEQGKLIGILLLGWRNSSGTRHTVPRNIIPVSQDVYSLPDDQVVAFHNDSTGRIQLHYFSQVIGNAGSFSVPLIESIIEQLEPACSSEDKQRLCVLRQALMWQRTVGGMRL